jgi:tetratricopeptide (TPR) repeat protein
MFIEPLVQAAFFADSQEERDSLYEYAGRRRSYMSRYGQLQLDLLLAYHDNDLQAQLRAARELHKLGRGSTFAYEHGATALSLNLLQESLDALMEFDPYAEWNRHFWGYWHTLAAVYHLLGDHEQELIVARRARELHPDRIQTLILEIQALAALGRVEEVRELLDQAPTLYQVPWQSAVQAGRELRAHGHLEESNEAFGRAIEWLKDLPEQEATQFANRRTLGFALYGAERWAEAREVFEELLAESPTNRTVMGWLAESAARMGDTATAKEIIEQLADAGRPQDEGDVLRARACIAALLGEADEAMRLLRQAFLEGHRFALNLHWDTSLESLRDREDYKELMRPKG